jgi:hypothetical protein
MGTIPDMIRILLHNPLHMGEVPLTNLAWTRVRSAQAYSPLEAHQGLPCPTPTPEALTQVPYRHRTHQTESRINRTG